MSCTLAPKILKNNYKNLLIPMKHIVYGPSKGILGVPDLFLIFFSHTFRPWPDTENTNL